MGTSKKGHKSLLAQAHGLWPTPKAEARNGGRSSDPRHGRVLDEEASLWPTPDAAATTRSNRSPSPGAAPRPALAALAALWPTPTANAWRSGLGSDDTMARNSRPLHEMVVSGWDSARSLPPPAIAPPGAPSLKPIRRLNPRFVEWLMGWPTGWTACAPAGTASCRWRLLMRSSLCWLIWRQTGE